jgi:GDP-D-mannose dehydratase
MATRILIAGITGVLGRRIATLLAHDGHAVSGISRWVGVPTTSGRSASSS